MLAVVAQNQTHIHIVHATNTLSNFIALRNSFFRNSSLSGTLYFNNSSRKVDKIVVLNSSTLNIGSGTNITFINNTADGAMALYNSMLNIGSDTNIIFINNSAPDGGAMTLFNCSILNIGRDAYVMFINNSAQRGGAITLYSSTLNIENDTEMTILSTIKRYL